MIWGIGGWLIRRKLVQSCAPTDTIVAKNKNVSLSKGVASCFGISREWTEFFAHRMDFDSFLDPFVSPDSEERNWASLFCQQHRRQTSSEQNRAMVHFVLISHLCRGTRDFTELSVELWKWGSSSSKRERNDGLWLGLGCHRRNNWISKSHDMDPRHELNTKRTRPLSADSVFTCALHGKIDKNGVAVHHPQPQN